jgi:RimJ/RimL family protein N-acetyltransferase
LKNYYDRAGDYYFVVEEKTSCRKEGLVSLYNLDNLNSRAEWGRWLLRRGSLAAVESVLLIFTFAFQMLKMNSVYSLTVADNKKVVSFHNSVGITSQRELPEYILINTVLHDAVEHSLDVRDWPAVRGKLENYARRLEER